MSVPAYRFTLEDARRGAERSNAVQAQASRERRENALALAEFAGELHREDVGPAMLGASLVLVACAVAGELPEPETPLDRLRLIEAAKILHTMARLEAGESTSNAMTLHASADDIAAARERIESKVQGNAVDAHASDTPARDAQ